MALLSELLPKVGTAEQSRVCSYLQALLKFAHLPADAGVLLGQLFTEALLEGRLPQGLG